MSVSLRALNKTQSVNRWHDKSSINGINFLNSEDLSFNLGFTYVGWSSHPNVIKQNKNVLSQVPYLLLKQTL